MSPPDRTQRRAKIADVAARAAVSIKTVSRVLNGAPEVHVATRERVQRAMADLDYVANVHARRLAARRIHVIGLVVPGLVELYSFYLHEIVRGVVVTAEAAGYQAIIVPAMQHPGSPDDYVRFLREGHADGLVVVARPENLPEITRLGEAGLPAVAIDDAFLGPNLASVTTNNRAAARAAVEHLIALGHRRIAHLAGKAEHGCSHEREAGYRDALIAGGYEHEVLVVRGNYSRASGFRLADQLLALPSPPTAFFCANDEMAAGALEAASRRGRRVGSDLAIVGFDDMPYAADLHPPLTTIHQPISEFGRRATEILLEQLRAASPLVRHEVLPCHLVVRASCGAVRPERANAVRDTAS